MALAAFDSLCIVNVRHSSGVLEHIWSYAHRALYKFDYYYYRCRYVVRRRRYCDEFVMQWYFSSKNQHLVLVHYQTAVSHRISSVLRECSYINSATLAQSL